MQKHLVHAIGGFVLAAPALAQTNWIQINPKTSPTGRSWHANAYDLARGRTIMFGGTDSGTNYVNDTWEYDGKDWTKMNPANKPSGRWLSSMVFHLARVSSVMFGGRDGNGGFPTDTWTWNGKDWTKMNPKNSPRGRWSHGMAYDSARQRTVLFGGSPGGGFLNDTWEWDGTNWTKIATKNSPSPRYANLAYDSVRKRVVMFGGFAGTGVVQDTWEYDGKDWIKMNPKAQPSARGILGIAYDPDRQRTVIFGGFSGYLNETWEYDGNTWLQMKTATSPPGRYDYDLMVYDSRRKRMVLFGGWNTSRLNDTWEYVASQTLTGSPSTVSIATGGTQTFTLHAGTAHSKRFYWIFGSVTGTSPGVTLASAVGSVTLPLNPDIWTDFTIALVNSAVLTSSRGTLDTAGKATAAFHIPKITNSSAIGLKFYHAYLVYVQNSFYMASNPVELTLVK